MLENKEELKNKIIYRSNYRGSKEMDILMISFVNSIIHKLNLKQLNELDNFVNMDDETFMSIKNDELLINFEDPSILKLVENFKNLKFNGGETGIRTQERVAPLLVFKTDAFNRSAISPFGCFY